jgi:hypothetical protein
VEITLSSFQKDALLLLQGSYPGFMPLSFTPSGQHSFSITGAEKLKITTGSDVLSSELNKPYSRE